MTVALPELRVGEPQRLETLSVFPLFSNSSSTVDYRLADEALSDESLLVEEVSEGGSVPNLLVENKGDVRVLFLEGEELVGAKQNRVLNTSVLVAAHSKIRIPVSCVEQGRWHYKSRHFASSGSQSPARLRRALKASVNRSLEKGTGHRSNQGEVWKEVGLLHAAFGVSSDSAAMSDAFDSYGEQIDAFREKLKYVDGAVGVAVAIGDRVVSVDLFDKPSTCQRVWNRLLTGVVFDAMAAEKTEQVASAADVQQLLDAAEAFPWQEAQAVGEGQEYRAESKQGDHASALACEDRVVHGSVVTAV
jgi:hypothetical protein